MCIRKNSSPVSIWWPFSAARDMIYMQTIDYNYEVEEKCSTDSPQTSTSVSLMQIGSLVL